MNKLDWALGITVLISIIVVLADAVLLGCAYFISVQFLKPFIICWFAGFVLFIITIVLGVIDTIKNK